MNANRSAYYNIQFFNYMQICLELLIALLVIVGPFMSTFFVWSSRICVSTEVVSSPQDSPNFGWLYTKESDRKKENGLLLKQQIVDRDTME